VCTLWVSGEMDPNKKMLDCNDRHGGRRMMRSKVREMPPRKRSNSMRDSCTSRALFVPKLQRIRPTASIVKLRLCFPLQKTAACCRTPSQNVAGAPYFSHSRTPTTKFLQKYTFNFISGFKCSRGHLPMFVRAILVA